MSPVGPDLVHEALENIAKGKGAFNRDPLQHASNCIDEMKALAVAAMNVLDNQDNAENRLAKLLDSYR